MEDRDVYKQGAEYEEEAPEILDSVAPKIPKKALYAAIAVVFIGIIAIAIYSSFGREPVKIADPIVEDTSEVDNLIDDLSFSKEEIAQLRAAGYTGDEIEEAEIVGYDFQSMVEQAEIERTKYLSELYLELSDKTQDSTSREFKELTEKTWLGGKPRVVSSPDNDIYNTFISTGIFDYIKLPARGTQLFIRLTMDDGQYIFMTIHPSRWVQLKDSGNMVVNYDVVEFGDEAFITNIVEVLME